MTRLRDVPDDIERRTKYGSRIAAISFPARIYRNARTDTVRPSPNDAVNFTKLQRKITLRVPRALPRDATDE